MPSTFPYDKDTDRWARKFKVDGLPHVALVDSSHRVQTALVGDVPYDIMQADVEALRKGKEVPFVMYDAFKNKPSNDILANCLPADLCRKNPELTNGLTVQNNFPSVF